MAEESFVRIRLHINHEARRKPEEVVDYTQYLKFGIDDAPPEVLEELSRNYADAKKKQDCLKLLKEIECAREEGRIEARRKPAVNNAQPMPQPEDHVGPLPVENLKLAAIKHALLSVQKSGYIREKKQWGIVRKYMIEHPKEFFDKNSNREFVKLLENAFGYNPELKDKIPSVSIVQKFEIKGNYPDYKIPGGSGSDVQNAINIVKTFRAAFDEFNKKNKKA